MEILKIQVKKDIFNKIVTGESDEVAVELTKTLAKRISKDGKSSSEEMLSDKSLIKDFDELYVSCMFSPDNHTFGISGFDIDGKNIVFKITDTNTPEKPAEKKVEKPAAKKDNKKKSGKSMSQRIDEVLDKFCEHKNVTKVGGPRVIVKPNGVLFGLKKRLPVKNDVEIHIDIETQKFYFTYDMTEDMFVKELETFLNRMVAGNFVFIWRSKCAYKEKEDGKRYLVLYYTTRKFVNQDKNRW